MVAMSTTLLALTAVGGLLIAYLLLVGALVVAGRRLEARALAGFVPDCAVLLGRLTRDPCVPRRRAALLIPLVAYLSSPIDLIPDFVPVVGLLDDAVLVALVLRLVVRGCSPADLEAAWPGPPSSLRVVLALAGVAA